MHKDKAASVRQFQREANDAAEVGRRALENRDEMEKQRDNALAKFVLNPHAYVRTHLTLMPNRTHTQPQGCSKSKLIPYCGPRQSAHVA